MFYRAAGNAVPDTYQIRGYIHNSTHVRFERADTGIMYVSWFVVECFGDEFSVQRGILDIAAGSIGKEGIISSVDTSRSIVVGRSGVNDSAALAGDTQDGYCTLELNDTTTIWAKRASVATGVALSVRYEVITFSEASGVTVQTGEATVSNPATTDVAFDTSIDKNK